MNVLDKLTQQFDKAITELATKLDQDIYCILPEEQIKLDEFYRTYVPPVLTVDQQLWQDYRNNILDMDTLSFKQMKTLLKMASEELDENDKHECW